ncbi:MAG: response regulator [Sphingomonas sp.]|uniref:response regulator n=1 Tax=Sphingomonas sp. TaxID=28214 RepID=UPI0025CED452|nr:response regulator [Sphingomonas sp.]MBX3565417.1 response regulator [Sphingomonas sp.]
MSRPRILLVDDDPAVRSSIAFALEIEGFDVATFGSAEALLSVGVAAPHACMVFDHRLPGLDGLALLAALRIRGEQAPAIIITSNPPQRLRQRVLDAGARLVEKPLLSDALVAAVREAASREGSAR